VDTFDRNAAHVGPLNDLVDALRRRGRFVPYVHSSQGGVLAPVLSVLQDPGKSTAETNVLCTDNPDRTSLVQRRLMATAGLSKEDMCPWNAYPWMRTPADGELTPELVAEGAVVLGRVLDLMQQLEVLLLQGTEARWAWAMVRAFRPRYERPRFKVIATCHPLGTRHRDPEQRLRIEQAQQDAWIRARAALRER